MRKSFVNILILASVIFTGCGTGGNKKETTSTNDSVTVAIAKEAYLYGLPLVLMDISRRQATSANSASSTRTAVNQFLNLSQFPDADFREVVRPNADTYYSSAWLNLEKEPLVLTVPDTRDRYYMMPMMDAYTNVFASPGKRTTGTKAGNFLITGPQWTGTIPAGMEQIKSPTNTAWIIGRTQVNSREDGDKVVVPIQKQYKLTPLSSWGKEFIPPAMTEDPNIPVGSPNEVVKNMQVDEFFNYINRLMISNPPPAADESELSRLATIGVGPGKKFDMTSFSAETQQVIKNIPQQVISGILENIKKGGKLVNGWKPLSANIGEYGTNYAERAFVSYVGLGANLPADAVYPSCSFDVDGNPLNGAGKYILHFDKGQTPPANAFWSLTMYNSEGYMVANPINRNTIGDRSNLKVNKDGSIDIYFQHASPGKDKEANWLPAPEGDFNILLRVYWPKEEMLNGTWSAPAIKKM